MGTAGRLALAPGGGGDGRGFGRSGDRPADLAGLAAAVGCGVGRRRGGAGRPGGLGAAGVVGGHDRMDPPATRHGRAARHRPGGAGAPLGHLRSPPGAHRRRPGLGEGGLPGVRLRAGDHHARRPPRPPHRTGGAGCRGHPVDDGRGRGRAVRRAPGGHCRALRRAARPAGGGVRGRGAGRRRSRPALHQPRRRPARRAGAPCGGRGPAVHAHGQRTGLRSGSPQRLPVWPTCPTCWCTATSIRAM